jgi:hypothetical protein
MNFKQYVTLCESKGNLADIIKSLPDSTLAASRTS